MTSTQKFTESFTERDPDYRKDWYNEHIKMIEKIAGKVLIRCAEHFHAKFLIIDPLDDDKMEGFISTANLNNKPLRVSVEIIKKLSKKQVKGIYKLFSYAFWYEATDEIYLPNRAESSQNKEVSLNENFFREITSEIVFTFKNHLKIRDELCDQIDKSQNNIVISTYGVDTNHIVFNKLEKHIKDGNTVQIFTQPREKQFDDLIQIKGMGIDVFGHDKLHAKFYLEKGKNNRSIIFTANLEQFGLDQGFEIGVTLSDEESKALEKIYHDWEKNFPWRFLLNIKIKDLQENTTILLNKDKKNKFFKYSIRDYKEVEIKKLFMAEDLRRMNLEAFDINLDIDKLKNEEEENLLYKKKIYSGEITPPILPIGAKLKNRDEKRYIFQKENIKYIGITSKKQMKKQEKYALDHNLIMVYFNEKVL